MLYSFYTIEDIKQHRDLLIADCVCINEYIGMPTHLIPERYKGREVFQQEIDERNIRWENIM